MRREDILLLLRHLLVELARTNEAIAGRYVREVNGRQEPRMDGFFVDCIVRKRHPLNVRGLRTWLWTAIDRNLERDRLCATELMMKELAQERASLPPPARGEDETVTAMTPPDGAPRAGKRRAENPELTKEKVPAALEKNAWRHEETARALGLTDRYALRRLLWKHDLEKPKK